MMALKFKIHDVLEHKCDPLRPKVIVSKISFLSDGGCYYGLNNFSNNKFSHTMDSVTVELNWILAAQTDTKAQGTVLINGKPVAIFGGVKVQPISFDDFRGIPIEIHVSDGTNYHPICEHNWKASKVEAGKTKWCAKCGERE